MAIHIKKANRGKLRKALGATAGQKISSAKLAKATHSKNPVLKKRAVFAQNARKWKH